MVKAILDEFGKQYMSVVRDQAILTVDRLLTGGDRSDRGRRLAAVLGDLTPDQVRTHRAIAIEAIDVALHNVLWMIEQSDTFDVVANVGEGTFQSLRDASDGLSGELYSDDGWIALFSRFGEDSTRS